MGIAPHRRAGELALADLLDLPVVRHPHTLLLPRIWELRKSISAYDAAYVALAEVFDAHFKLATEIILLRRQRGLTQRQLSTKSGVQQATARRITTGAP